ncbi:hypothetical protein ACP4OV_005536 [Aristida adscensionis]
MSSDSEVEASGSRRKEVTEVEEVAPVITGTPALAARAATAPTMVEEEAEAERPWALLASVPRRHGEPDLLRKHFSFHLVRPPCVSVLRAAICITIGGRLLRETPATRSRGFYYPYVAAADPSGAILLCAGHRSDWNGPDEPNRARFFLCDAASGKATQLPDHLFARHAGRMGLIRDDGGRVMVAYLNHAPASASRQASTSLLCHWAGSEGWTTKPLACPVDVAARDWGKDGVVALGGRLWWVDLACGLLTCDPFADAPDLAYIPLPPGCGLPDAGPGVRRELDKRRFVKASRGRLRFVDIHLADDGGGDPTVTMWTARDGGWVPRYSVAFPEIWAHPSFTASRAAEPERYDCDEVPLQDADAEPLVPEVPALALVNPFDPDVLYFWQGTQVFAVDVPEKTVVARGGSFVMPKYRIPEGEFHSSRSLHAWVLPPAIVRDMDGPGCCFSFLNAVPSYLCGRDEEYSDHGSQEYLSPPDSE